jgi:hypothetical protein
MDGLASPCDMIAFDFLALETLGAKRLLVDPAASTQGNREDGGATSSWLLPGM